MHELENLPLTDKEILTATILGLMFGIVLPAIIIYGLQLWIK